MKVIHLEDHLEQNKFWYSDSLYVDTSVCPIPQHAREGDQTPRLITFKNGIFCQCCFQRIEENAR